MGYLKAADEVYNVGMDAYNSYEDYKNSEG